MSTFRNLLFNTGKEWEGTPPLALTGATSAPATDYKLYGKTVYGEVVPDEYTQLEYLVTPASSYFDTGVTSANTVKCELTIQLTSRTTTTAHLMGDVITPNTKGYSLNTATNTAGVSRFGADSYTGAFPLSEGKNVVTVGQDGYFVNGVSVWTPSAQTFTGDEFWIGAANTTNAIQGIIGYIYGCKIWVSGVLTRNYIPVKRKSDNKVGLYDLVNNTFNAGVGTFTAGPAYTPQPTPEAPLELVSVGDKVSANLFDETAVITGKYLDSSGTLISNGSWTVSDYMPVTGGESYYQTLITAGTAPRTCWYTSDKTFISASGQQTGGVLIAPVNAVYCRMSVFSVEVSAARFVHGTTPREYDYKIPVKVVSANLLHDDNIVTAYSATGNYMYNGYMGASSGSHDTYIASDKYKTIHVVLPAGTYTWWTDTEDCHTLRYSIGSTVSSYGNDVNYHTFTLTETSEYQMCWRNINSSVIGDVHSMIIKGTTAPASYIPYYNTTTNIILSEPLRQVKSSDGTVKYTDYIDYGNQKIVRQVGYEEFNSESTFIHYSSVNGLFLSSIPLALLQSTAPFVGMCSHFAVKEATEVVSIDDLQCCFQTFSGSTVATFGLRYKAKVNPTNALKEWLGLQKANGTPVTIYYPLETATQTPVTLPSITLEGGATISVDTTVNASNLWIKQ